MDNTTTNQAHGRAATQSGAASQFACSAWLGCVRPNYPARRIGNGAGGAEWAEFPFYVGLDDLYYAFRFERSFISVNRLRARKSPFKVNKWSMDSGAFTEVTTHGGYRTEPEEYAKEIERWRLCGNMEAAVCQDYMCEPFVTAKTGLTVRDHQRLTIERFDRLRAATAAPLLPVLQGFKPHEYREHLADYGHRLALGARVGVGSVCKRQSKPEVISVILYAITDMRPDLKWHMFGLKKTALAYSSIRSMIFSADSMAWSYHARRNKRSAHDWREAKQFEEDIQHMELNHTPHQPQLCL